MNFYEKKNVHLDNMESPDTVGGKFLDVRECDRDRSVGLGTSRRPILVALDPRPLLEFGHHHYRCSPHLPAHAPEIDACLWQGSLSKEQYNEVGALVFFQI